MNRIFICFVAVMLLIPFQVNAETINFSFHARRHISLDEATVVRRPFVNCWIYIFQLTGDEEAGETELVPACPMKLDEGGKCDFDFERGETYFLYFSGKELDANESEFVFENKDLLAVPFFASFEQREDSSFDLENRTGNNFATLKYSSPLWITQLQKLEAALQESDVNVEAKELLTKCRKLFDDGGFWNFLAPTETTNLFEYDSTTGEITRNEIPVRICEAISRTYRRDGDRLEIRDGKPLVEERFDLVSGKSGLVFRIDQLLFAFDAEVAATPPSTELRIIDSASNASWGKCLGEAAYESIKRTNRPPRNPQWDFAVSRKADIKRMVGGLVGTALAAEFGAAIADERPASLSIALGAILNFEEETIVTKFQDQIRDESGASQSSDIVRRAASSWTFSSWDRLHLEAKDSAAERAANYLDFVLDSFDIDD